MEATCQKWLLLFDWLRQECANNSALPEVLQLVFEYANPNILDEEDLIKNSSSESAFVNTRPTTFALISFCLEQNIPIFIYDDSQSISPSREEEKFKKQWLTQTEINSNVALKFEQKRDNVKNCNTITKVYSGEKFVDSSVFARMRANEIIAKRIMDAFPSPNAKIFIPIGVNHLFNFDVIGDYNLKRFFENQGRSVANVICLKGNEYRITNDFNWRFFDERKISHKNVKNSELSLQPDIKIDSVVTCHNIIDAKKIAEQQMKEQQAKASKPKEQEIDEQKKQSCTIM